MNRTTPAPTDSPFSVAKNVGAPSHDSLTQADCINRWTQTPWICSYDLTLATIGALTGIVCIFAITRVWGESRKHWFSTRLAVLFINELLCIMVAFHYIWYSGAQMALIIHATILLQYSVVCWFFWDILEKIMQNKEVKCFRDWLTLTRIFRTVLIAMLAGETVLIIWALAYTNLTCQDIPWITIAIFQVVIALFYIFAIRYFIYQLNSTQFVINNYRHRKKKQLWILVCVNCLSSVVELIYEIFNLYYSHLGCDVFIQQNTVGNFLLRMFVRVTNIFLPIWAVFFVFWDWSHKSSANISFSGFRRMSDDFKSSTNNPDLDSDDSWLSSEMDGTDIWNINGIDKTPLRLEKYPP